ncbi:hypothetical protein L210DRAFT_3510141 [Boletus edulis BED1]|uniref:Peptidase M3A/M3B catalytic domain-containing protein n=2 Tax=Boletus edulis BED1 TaxID=1328754 RepID=A0AAD4BDN6_BOLED|nr:hypothetical protein L210DRAFT_3510141 [Boletus edulis BED1]
MISHHDYVGAVCLPVYASIWIYLTTNYGDVTRIDTISIPLALTVIIAFFLTSNPQTMDIEHISALSLITSFSLDFLVAIRYSNQLKSRLGIQISQIEFLGAMTIGALNEMLAKARASAGSEAVKDWRRMMREHDNARKRAVSMNMSRYEATQWATHEGYFVTISSETFKYANDPKTREAAQQAFDDRLANNVGYLDTALRLRRQIAEILQYDFWADYITEVKMVKSAANAKKPIIISVLIPHWCLVFGWSQSTSHLDPLGTQDRATLLGLKKERCIPTRNLDFDDFLVKKYFPVSVVVPAVLDIYQNLLGVKFVEITGDARDVWHLKAQQFAVWEMDAKDESGFIGYCYLDLFPREGKYSHAAVWGLHPGYELPEGKRQHPLIAIVANLAKLTPERPALMRHDDVTTFFHEMGAEPDEILILTVPRDSRRARLRGGTVPDARELPEVLKKMSSHYKTQEPLSDDLIAKIIKSRYVNVGLFYLRQLFFANLDLAVHNNEATTYPLSLHIGSFTSANPHVKLVFRNKID